MDYPPQIREELEERGVGVGDQVEIMKGGEVFKGTLMPRTGEGESNCLVIKLDNGYNVGVEFSEDAEIEKVGGTEGEGDEMDLGDIKDMGKLEVSGEKPEITILAAGGTIASRVDYRTGAVKPSVSEEDLIGFTPELSSLADIKGRQLFQELSENLIPEHWQEIAEAVEEEIEKGKDGVVIMHGTDTMAYTAAALSFMLENLPVPVVLVGSQRSSDRGSTDAHQNLTCAVRAAGSDIAEVMICMHGESSDTYCYLHPGVKVRKMHTSRRDAFRTVNGKPFAKVDWEDLEIEKVRNDYRKRDGERDLELREEFNDNVALVKSYPGLIGEDLENQIKDKDGIVLEGTGLGHIPLRERDSEMREVLKDYLEGGGIAFMASQCLYGRVNMNVYETGVDLQDMGVKGNLSDMLPEVAWVKLGWLLENYSRDKVESLMTEDLRGELGERSKHGEFYGQ